MNGIEMGNAQQGLEHFPYGGGLILAGLMGYFCL